MERDEARRSMPEPRDEWIEGDRGTTDRAPSSRGHATHDDRSLGDPGSPPEMLGRYVVLGTLGHGGMGTVLSAFDRSLDRRVALKVLHDELGRRRAARLRREAQALAQLSHPNVVQVYEVGESE
ncbi:MAG: protein kinase, partial [Myxococcales bacterium]|nr:protein kinase [Myxococcales bacterium]